MCHKDNISKGLNSANKFQNCTERDFLWWTLGENLYPYHNFIKAINTIEIKVRNIGSINVLLFISGGLRHEYSLYNVMNESPLLLEYSNLILKCLEIF